MGYQSFIGTDNVYRTKFLSTFFIKYEYDLDAQQFLLNEYAKLCKNNILTKTFFELVNRYEKTIRTNIRNMLSEATVIASKVGIHHYALQLLLFIFMTKRLKYNCMKRGISEMYDNLVLDLKYKCIECKLVKGVWGTFVPSWHVYFFKLEILSFGVLQMHLTKGLEYKDNKISINKEDAILKVHIPRTGGRLDKEKVDEAYKKASEYYTKKHKLKRIIFICESWLLFPKNKEFLKETSNIYKFISDYKIYKVEYYQDYSQVWRLFDMDYTGDPDFLPTNTSFRRAYVDMIKNGEKLGDGYGIFVYE